MSHISLTERGRRIGAEELTAWLRHELDGYEFGNSVPLYRDGSHLPIEVRFDGPMNSYEKRTFHRNELDESLTNGLDKINIWAPVAELVELARGENDPVVQLPVQWLVLYRRLAGESKAPSVPYMIANHAVVKIPATHLTGVLDRVKTTALDLALSIEDVSDEAGAAGGPTVADEPRLAETVTIHLTQLFAAPGATIVSGDNATVASAANAVAVRLEVGDIQGLLTAARDLVGPLATDDLEAALAEDGDRPGPATTTVMDRIKAGGYVLAGGVTTNGAYDLLAQLLHQVPGDHRAGGRQHRPRCIQAD